MIIINKPDTHSFSPIPKVADRLSNFFLSEKDYEAITGDLQEEYSTFITHAGIGIAQLWFWIEILKSMPSLF